MNESTVSFHEFFFVEKLKLRVPFRVGEDAHSLEKRVRDSICELAECEYIKLNGDTIVPNWKKAVDISSTPDLERSFYEVLEACGRISRLIIGSWLIIWEGRVVRLGRKPNLFYFRFKEDTLAFINAEMPTGSYKLIHIGNAEFIEHTRQA